jgi:hypothetical protein
MWMRWTGHVANMGRKKNAYGILFGKLKGRDFLGDIFVDGRITSKWIWNLVTCGQG